MALESTIWTANTHVFLLPQIMLSWDISCMLPGSESNFWLYKKISLETNLEIFDVFPRALFCFPT